MSGEIYRGPDRRRRATTLGRSEPGFGALAVLLGGAGATLLAEVLAGRVGAVLALVPVADMMRIVATALFFGAGAARFARWRVTGEAYMAGNAVALLVFALATYPLSVALRAVVTIPASSMLPSLARLVTVLVVAAIIIPALRSSPVDSTLRPVRSFGYVLAGTVAGFVAITLLLTRTTPALVSSSAAALACEFLVVAAWLMLALICFRIGLRRSSSSMVWSAVALALLGLSALAHGSNATGTSGTPWLFAAALLGVAAAAVSFLNAVRDVQEALASEGDELVSATSALTEAGRLLARTEARRQELVHDARSMITSLRLASTTLDRSGDHLNAETAARLRSAMDIELARLGRLIEGANATSVFAFDVGSALHPVLAIARGEGHEIVSELNAASALGRPDDLAEVVSGLIANAHRHAPGSPVTVRTEATRDEARVYVEDRGAGVPDEHRALVFERGFTDGAGDGLGLYVARRLMREQGGDLRVHSRQGGGASFVASLPAVGARSARPASDAASQSGEQVVERGQVEKLPGPLDAVDTDAGRDARVLRQLDDHVRRGLARSISSDDHHVERRPSSGVGLVEDGVAEPGKRKG